MTAAPFRLYNSLKRKIEDFTPIQPGKIKLYSYFGCFLGWFLGFPIGIWALVIVMDPMVRERFST